MTDLYNLQPLLQMLLMVSVVLMVPWCWLWLRKAGDDRPQRVQRLTLWVLFLTFDLLIFGAFTRLTDSGLGCPDWPGCYGAASPLGAHADIAQAQALMPDGPVTHGKAWIEMIHRYLAMSVGGLILTLAVFAWVEHRRGVPQTRVWWPTLTLLWVMVQGGFGALTVTMKLFPLIVSMHLMGGMVLLGLLSIQVAQQGGLVAWRMPWRLRPLTILTLVLLSVQVFLGAWVSTNYAVLACDTFPQCQGSWWPAMDFRGFEWWRPLGMSASGEYLPVQALTAIHWVHRLMAGVVMCAMLALALRLRRLEPAAWHWRGLLVLTGLQLCTGVSNVVLGWPLWAALMHTAGASLLWVLLWVGVVSAQK